VQVGFASVSSLFFNHLFSFAGQVIRTPRRIVAPGVLLTDGWATKPGADSWAYRALDGVHREVRPETPAKQETLRRILQWLSLQAEAPTRGTALVFLHRGDAILHSCHHLIIAAGLARLGHAVELVHCDGSVERCGVGQVRAPLAIPPITCFNCRSCLTPLAGATVPTLALGEPRRNAFQAASPELDTPLPHDFDRLLYPALLRHFQGHLPEIAADRRERAAHAAAARRFIARCHAMFQTRQPAVVCLFNGQTFPESIIGSVAIEMGIPVIYTERSVLPNSLFMSRDIPASHYVADRLWAECREAISDSDRAQARAFVAARRRVNIDPLGVNRGFEKLGADAAHAALTAKPYAICFAPVLHDTAAAGKDNGLGEVPEALVETCRAARAAGVRLVIRSHPDERRPHNPARYTIRQMLVDRGVVFDDTIVNLDSDSSWNPYVLAERASHVIVHNGTIAMECGVAGIRTINTGRSHYGGKGFTLDPHSPLELRTMLGRPVERLDAQEIANAEAYLHFYLHRATLDISGLLEEGADFTCRVLPPSPQGEEQLEHVTQRLAFLLESAPGPACA